MIFYYTDTGNSRQADEEIAAETDDPMEASSASEKTSKFYATDACTACGLCMDICPTRCIRPDDGGRPLWAGACKFCLACLRHCPAEAIRYRRDTLNKRPYINPSVKL